MPLAAFILLSAALFPALSREASAASEEKDPAALSQNKPGERLAEAAESHGPPRKRGGYPKELMNLIHDSIKLLADGARSQFKSELNILQGELENNVLSKDWDKKQAADFLLKTAREDFGWRQSAALAVLPDFLTEENSDSLLLALSLARSRIPRGELRPDERIAAILGAGRILRAFPFPEEERIKSFHTIKEAISDSSASGRFIQEAMKETALLLKAWDMPLAHAQEAFYHISGRIFDGGFNGYHTAHVALMEAHEIMQAYSLPLEDAQRALHFIILYLSDEDARLYGARLSFQAIKDIFEKYKLPEENLTQTLEALIMTACREFAGKAADLAARAVFRGVLADEAKRQFIAERKKDLSGANEKARISSIFFFSRISRLMHSADKNQAKDLSLISAVREALLEIEEIFVSSDNLREQRAAMQAVEVNLNRNIFSSSRQSRSLRLMARLLHSEDRSAAKTAQKSLERIVSAGGSRRSLDLKLQARRYAAEALAEDPLHGKNRSLAVFRAADSEGLPVDEDIIFLITELVSHPLFYSEASDYLLETDQRLPGTLKFSHAYQLTEMMSGAEDDIKGAALKLLRHILRKDNPALSETERVLLSLEMEAKETAVKGGPAEAPEAPANDGALSPAAARCKETLLPD